MTILVPGLGPESKFSEETSIMKKRIVAFLLTTGLLLSLAGCGQGKALKDYAGTLSSQMEVTESQSTVTNKVSVEGDKLVIAISYDFPVDDLTPELQAQYESDLELNKAFFNKQLEELKAAGVDKPVVVGKYLDSNGKELASKEFTLE